MTDHETDADFLARMRLYIEWGPEYAAADGSWSSPAPPQSASDVKRALLMAKEFVTLQKMTQTICNILDNHGIPVGNDIGSYSLAMRVAFLARDCEELPPNTQYCETCGRKAPNHYDYCAEDER